VNHRKIRLVDLLDEPWVLPDPETEVGSLVAALFQASGLEVPRAAVVGNALEMSWALLATGKFLTALPQSVLRFSAQRPTIKVLRVKLPVRPRPVGIVTLRNRTLSPAAQLFIDCVHDKTAREIISTGYRAANIKGECGLHRWRQLWVIESHQLLQPRRRDLLR
jgi:DNA-binding transcriptional LysR family regulator